jgi:hypothetical protein
LTYGQPYDIIYIEKQKEDKTMWYYYFWDEVTGEEFYVMEYTEEKAMEIAKEYFEDPRCDGVVEDWIAEMSGYDVY